MSINSWKREFYKGRLRDAAKDPMAAVRHSLRKWKGLKPENLAKHGLEASLYAIYNPETGGTFEVTSNTCALCLMCMPPPLEGIIPDCNQCPIVKVTGQSCTATASPYTVWVDHDDPKPMIKLLKQTRDGMR